MYSEKKSIIFNQNDLTLELVSQTLYRSTLESNPIPFFISNSIILLLIHS